MVVKRSGIRAVVVGSLNADLVVELPRIPLVGETRKASALRHSAGGKGANQAVALARLGVAVDMVGQVGDDAEGRTLLAQLTAAGVSATHVAVAGGEPTGLAVVMVDARGDNAIVVVPGANGTMAPAAVAAAEAAFAQCDVVLTQLETPRSTVEAALRRGREAGALVVLNAAPAAPLPDSLLALVDVLVVNEQEALEIAGGTDVEAAAGLLLRRGPRAVVVTLGAAGALMHDGNDRITAAGFAVQPVDTSGAGDCFVAALAVALSEKSPPAEALGFANAAAAVTVTRRGTQDAMPTRDDVEAFLGVKSVGPTR
jgi:ribokinase